jgi:hypothetical protein
MKRRRQLSAFVNQHLAIQVCGLWCLGPALGCGSSAPPEPEVGELGEMGGAIGGAAGGVATSGASGGPGAGGSVAGGSGTGGAPIGAAGSGAGGTNAGVPGNRPCGKLFYSGEPGEITLASGSTWADPKGTAGTNMITETTDNPHSGTTALKIALDWNPGEYGGDYGWSFGNYSAAKAIDTSTATTLSIWMRADHQVGGFNVWLNDVYSKPSKFYGVPGGTIGTTWKELRVPLTAFAMAGFDPTKVDTFASDMHDDGNGAVTWYLDDGVFVTACP